MRSEPDQRASLRLDHKMPECNICAAPYGKNHAYTCAQCAFVCCQVCHVRALTEPTLGRCPGCPAGLDLGTFLINVPVLATEAQQLLAAHFGKLYALRERTIASDPREPTPATAEDFLDTGAPLSSATYSNLRARTDRRTAYTYPARVPGAAEYLAAPANTRAGAGPASVAPGFGPDASAGSLDNEANADLAAIRAAGVECRPCPGCRAVISRVSGCSQMWCVLCHAKFDYNTGAIITGFFHNPHFFDHARGTVLLEGAHLRMNVNPMAFGSHRHNLAIWYDEVLLGCLEAIMPGGGEPRRAITWENFCQEAYNAARAIIAISVYTGVIENARLGIEALTCGEAVVRLRSAIAQLHAHRRLYASRAIPRALERAARVIETGPSAALLTERLRPEFPDQPLYSYGYVSVMMPRFNGIVTPGYGPTHPASSGAPLYAWMIM